MDSAVECNNVARSSPNPVDDLLREVKVAMSAMARNSLPEIEASVARQEVLCAALDRSLPLFRKDRTPEVAEPLNHAAEEIRQVALEYESLLRRSIQSATQISALCRSHTGQAQKDSGIGWKQQTWSCEG